MMKWKLTQKNSEKCNVMKNMHGWSSKRKSYDWNLLVDFKTASDNSDIRRIVFVYDVVILIVHWYYYYRVQNCHIHKDNSQAADYHLFRYSRFMALILQIPDTMVLNKSDKIKHFHITIYMQVAIPPFLPDWLWHILMALWHSAKLLIALWSCFHTAS